jgi:hypothetical protein
MPTLQDHDCATHATTVREMTEEEAAAHESGQRDARDVAAGRQAARHQRDADLALIAANPDPQFQALARVLGA